MPEEPYTHAELEAGAEASWANAWDGVPPDLQPWSPPWPEFAAANRENADYFRRKAAQVLRAVLPDHDARVRADERARTAEEIAQAIEAAELVPGSLRNRQKACAAIARAHATTPEEDQHG